MSEAPIIEQGLSIEKLAEALAKLPPPLPAFEILHHPLISAGRYAKRFRVFRDANVSPLGGELIPTRENEYIPEGILVQRDTKLPDFRDVDFMGGAHDFGDSGITVYDLRTPEEREAIDAAMLRSAGKV